MEWEADVLAKFLYQRAQQLFKPEHQAAPENAWLGHHLVALAAQVDPYFEDAVYAHELARLDGHAPDWHRLTGDSQAPITPVSDD